MQNAEIFGYFAVFHFYGKNEVFEGLSDFPFQLYVFGSSGFGCEQNNDSIDLAKRFA